MKLKVVAKSVTNSGSFCDETEIRHEKSAIAMKKFRH